MIWLFTDSHQTAGEPRTTQIGTKDTVDKKSTLPRKPERCREVVAYVHLRQSYHSQFYLYFTYCGDRDPGRGRTEKRSKIVQGDGSTC